MENILIKNVCIMNGQTKKREVTTCYLSNEKFIAFEQAPMNFTADKIIDAQGAWMIPPLIDLSVNLFRKNQNDLPYLAHSLSIAKKHGIKYLCQWPTTEMTFDNPTTVSAITQHYSIQGHSQLLPIAALTENLDGKMIANMALLNKAGAIGFSQGDHPIANTQVLLNAFAYAASFNLTVFIRPQDPWLNQAISIHQGVMSEMLGIEGIPSESEILEVQRCLTLAKKTGVKLHLSGISCKESIALIRQAKQQGILVSADVALPNLFLTEMDLANFEPACHLIPPLRSLMDQEALLAGIQDGTINAICSHNRSCSLNGKRNPLALTPAGYHGLTSFLPLLLMLSEKLNMDFMLILALATEASYQILNKKLPKFNIGSIADFVLFNPNKFVQQQESIYQSPFANWHLSGVVEHVCFDGKFLTIES